MQPKQQIWDLAQDPFREREVKKYKDALPSREYILTCMNFYEKPLTAKQLAEKFDIAEKTEILKIRLGSMEREGQIFKNRTGAYALPDKLSLIKGKVEAHKDGYGWLLVEDKTLDDIYLSAKQMRRLWHGDQVLAKEVTGKYRGKTEAIVVEILERGIDTIIGRLKLDKSGNFGQVYVENKHIQHQVLVSSSDMGAAKDGDLVEVQIIEHPSMQLQASGRILKKLDEDDSIATFLEVTAKNHKIDTEFNSETLNEAKAFGDKIDAREKQERADLTNLEFVTIDGEDAKDFDDAVYCKWLETGEFRLIVAIADVSAYVKAGSNLDASAKERGTSVYFPNRVIPMLPFSLSDNLCSLMPNVERLAMVCDMHISASGKIETFDFYKAVIKSYARLTYTQVGDYLSGNFDENSELAKLLNSKNLLMNHLDNMSFLHKNLLNMRHRRNAINFNRRELSVLFDDLGKINKIVESEKNIAHSLIEEFMLCANVSAADLALIHNLGALFRNHEKPSAENLENLQTFLLTLGLKLEGGFEPSTKDYGKLLKQISARDDFEIIQTMLLRSMQQAVYSEENRGHFALAYEKYTHFTSPIRRYPDLLLHREISNLIEKSTRENISLSHIKTFKNFSEIQNLKSSNNCVNSAKTNIKNQKEAAKEKARELHNLGLHLSTKERNAELASRDLMDYLKCLYMQDYLGEVFAGKVVSVTGFGLFVELESLYIDGLIHISTLPADYYIHEAKFQMLKGRRSNRQFKLGDRLNIQVAGISVEERKIDFILYQGNLHKDLDRKKPQQSRYQNSKFLGDKKMQDDIQTTEKTQNTDTNAVKTDLSASADFEKPATQAKTTEKTTAGRQTRATSTRAKTTRTVRAKTQTTENATEKMAQAPVAKTTGIEKVAENSLQTKEKKPISKAIPRKRASTSKAPIVEKKPITAGNFDNTKIEKNKTGVLEKVEPKANELDISKLKDMAEAIEKAEPKKEEKQMLHEKAVKKAIDKKLAKKAARKAEKKKEKKKLKEKIKKQRKKLKKKQKQELKDLKTKTKELQKQIKKA